MSDLKIIEDLSFKPNIPLNYYYTLDDLNANTEILFSEIKSLSIKFKTLIEEQNKDIVKLNKRVDKIFKTLKKIPGANFVKGIFK